MSNDLKMKCELSKEYYVANSQPQIAYVLIEAKSSGNRSSGKTPFNLGLVMDRSASMKGEKIENVKTAICNIIDHLDSEDTLSLVIFNEQAEVLIPAQFVQDKSNLKEQVNQLGYSGGTAISSGIRLGLAEMEKNVSGDRINRLIILTDGQTYGDEDDCYQLASGAAEKGIAITALGVGDEWHEEVLDTIADRNSGKSDYIATPADIIPIFEEEMTTLENIVTQNNLMRLRFSDGVQPRKICRVVPYISELDYDLFSENEVGFNLGELDSEQGASVLVELMFDPKQEGKYRISQAELAYDVPGQRGIQQKVREDIVAQFADDESVCKKINPKVMNIVEKVSAYDLQTRAISQARVGQIDGATQKLKAAATRLLDMGEHELADVAFDEIENLERKGSMTSAGTKKLHYETRKLTQRLVA